MVIDIVLPAVFSLILVRETGIKAYALRVNDAVEPGELGYIPARQVSNRAIISRCRA